MNFFKSSLNLTLLSLLTCAGLAAPVLATPDNDNSISNAAFEGSLNPRQGFPLTIKGRVTSTDDPEDFRKINLTDTTNLRLIEDGVAPNGGRTDLLLVRDFNNNGAIDSGEIIGQSRNQFSHQITRKNLSKGDYIVIIRSRQLSTAAIQYQVTAQTNI